MSACARVARNGKAFTKTDFPINMRDRTIRCQAGHVEHFEPGSVVEFDPEACGRRPLRARCTMASPTPGRTVSIAEDELLWDDRAWAKVDVAMSPGDDDDSGVLAAPGEDSAFAARDAAWGAFDEGGRVTAVAFVPGGSVVVALESPGRPRLVRILPDGVARIIAEIEESADDDPSVVTSLRRDGALGQLVAAGTFGVQAFRPT